MFELRCSEFELRCSKSPGQAQGQRAEVSALTQPFEDDLILRCPQFRFASLLKGKRRNLTPPSFSSPRVTHAGTKEKNQKARDAGG